MRLILLILWAGILMSFSRQAEAQVMVGSIPSYYNPSFVGGAGGPRLSTFSHIKAVSGQGLANNRHFISYDQFIPKIASGIGFNLEYNRLNSIAPERYFSVGHIPSHNQYYSAELIYAPKISLNGRFTISPSVSAKLNNQNFRTQVSEGVANHLHLGAGLLLNSKRFYLGYSIYHLADEIKGGRYSASPWTSMVQAGYTFQRSDDAKFAFTPQLLWINRHRFAPASDLLPAGVTLNFRYKKFLFGTGFDHKAVYPFMIGYQNDKIRVMFMGIPSFSKLQHNTFISSLSFRYLLGKDKNKNMFTSTP